MSRGRRGRDQRTAMERGACMAYVAAVVRIRHIEADPQLHLFESRRLLLAEWYGIRSAAALALA